MTMEQMTQKVNDMEKELAVIRVKQNNDHTRIEENKVMSTQIHKCTSMLEHLTAQFSNQNEQWNRYISSFDQRMKEHGERIGDVELTVGKHTVVIPKITQRLDDTEASVDELKTKGSKRLEGIMDGVIVKVIFMVLGAALMYLIV